MRATRSATLFVLLAGLSVAGPREAAAKDAVEGEWAGEIRTRTKIVERVRAAFRIEKGRLAGEFVVPKEWNPGASETFRYVVKDASPTEEGGWRIEFGRVGEGPGFSVVLRAAGEGLSGPVPWATDLETVMVLRPAATSVPRAIPWGGEWAGTQHVDVAGGTVVRVLRVALRALGASVTGTVRAEDPATGDCPAAARVLPPVDGEVEVGRIFLRLPSPSRGFVGLDLMKAGDVLDGAAIEGVFLDGGVTRLLDGGPVRLTRGADAKLAAAFEPAKPGGARKPGEVPAAPEPSEAELAPFLGRWEGSLTEAVEPAGPRAQVTLTLTRADGRLGGELRVAAEAPEAWTGKKAPVRAPRLREDTLFLDVTETNATGPAGSPQRLAVVLGSSEGSPVLLGCARGWPTACGEFTLRLRRPK